MLICITAAPTACSVYAYPTIREDQTYDPVAPKSSYFPWYHHMTNPLITPCKSQITHNSVHPIPDVKKTLVRSTKPIADALEAEILLAPLSDGPSPLRAADIPQAIGVVRRPRDSPEPPGAGPQLLGLGSR